MQNLTFTFTGTTGQALGQLTMDVTASSRVWFESATSEGFGGQFTAEVPFTLQSASASAGTNLVANVHSIAVRAGNEVGTSNTVEGLVQ